MSNFNPARRAARKAAKDRRGYTLRNDGTPKSNGINDARFNQRSKIKI